MDARSETINPLPAPLLDLLHNALVFRETIPYLSIRDLLALSQTCKKARGLLVQHETDAWRRLDLSGIRAARAACFGGAGEIDDGGGQPIDVGGIAWRAERMDESLTEDDFYAGPLRGILSKVHARRTLRFVQTLVLDGLSVPADLIRELIGSGDEAGRRYAVRMLSLRGVRNLNQARLRQVLRYAARPSRPEGSPTVKAIYLFGPKEGVFPVSLSTTAAKAWAGRGTGGVMASEGAQIGAEWNQRSSTALSTSLDCDEETRWYGATGAVLRPPQSDWAETLAVCKSVFAFDAVLCRGPRHDITKVDSRDFLQPAIATVALGSHGCENCHSCPEGPAVFGESPESAFPLLGPAPYHASSVRAGQLPQGRTEDGRLPPLILRCLDCLRGRHCERCQRWWCEDCFSEPISRTRLLGTNAMIGGDVPIALQAIDRDGGAEVGWPSGTTGPSIKIPVGVHRDCFVCGRTCEWCKIEMVRKCRNCTTEYCYTHDDGCSGSECAWCNRSGRRTRELY